MNNSTDTFIDPFANPDCPYAFIPQTETEVGETVGECWKCRRPNRRLRQSGGVGVCGTCLHREDRRINTLEMYGKGRRGY